MKVVRSIHVLIYPKKSHDHDDSQAAKLAILTIK